MKNIFILLVGIMLISCSGELTKSADKVWEEEQKYRKEEKVIKSITSFKEIMKTYPNHDLCAQAKFKIADIYLNNTKDFEYAVNEFKKVVENYPKHEVAKKSLFMIAYIYNNYIEAYSDAIIHYNLFKEKYPDDELVPSVNFELDGLNRIQSKIDSLNTMVNKN